MKNGTDNTRLILVGGFWRMQLPDGTLAPNIAGGHTNPVLSQAHFRVRNDDGTEATATWKAAEDTNPPSAQAVDTNFRIRFTIDETAGGDPASQSWQLQYNLNSAGWNNVSGASSVVRSSASPNEADGTATANRLTAPAGTFQASEFDEVDGLTAALDLGVGNFTEVEYCVQIRSADVVNGDSIQLRVVGTTTNPLDNYAITPTITALAPIAVNQATETDLAQAVAWAPKARLVTQSTETGLAQIVTSGKALPVGLTTETDLAQAVTAGTSRAVGILTQFRAHLLTGRRYGSFAGKGAGLSAAVNQATETDLAQAVASAKVNGLGQASETETAQAVTEPGAQVVSVGQAAEADLAQPLTAKKEQAVGFMAETDLAQAVASQKAQILGQVTEADLAQAVTEPGTLIGSVEQVNESDLAQAVAWAPKIRIVNGISELNAAQALTIRKIQTLGIPVDGELAQTLAHRKAKGLGLTSETDLAQTILWNPKVRILGQATEADLAQVVTMVKGKLIQVIKLTAVTGMPARASDLTGWSAGATTVAGQHGGLIDVEGQG